MDKKYFEVIFHYDHFFRTISLEKSFQPNRKILLNGIYLSLSEHSRWLVELKILGVNIVNPQKIDVQPTEAYFRKKNQGKIMNELLLKRPFLDLRCFFRTKKEQIDL